MEVARMTLSSFGLVLAAEVPDAYAAYMPSKFDFYELCFALVWAVWAVLNFWIWSKSKALGNLLMLIGSAATSLFWFIAMFQWGMGVDPWLHFLALVTLSIGFFFTV